MVTRIIPQFFTADLARTLEYYSSVLGFDCEFQHGDPPFYAGVARDGHAIFFRLVPDVAPVAAAKYAEELLDAYVGVSDAAALSREYADRGVEFHRPLGETPWQTIEFVVRDCDGRLLCFGQTPQG